MCDMCAYDLVRGEQMAANIWNASARLSGRMRTTLDSIGAISAMRFMQAEAFKGSYVISAVDVDCMYDISPLVLVLPFIRSVTDGR